MHLKAAAFALLACSAGTSAFLTSPTGLTLRQSHRVAAQGRMSSFRKGLGKLNMVDPAEQAERAGFGFSLGKRNTAVLDREQVKTHHQVYF